MPQLLFGPPPGGAAAPPFAAGAPLGDPREQRALGAARLRPGDPLLGALDAGAGLLRAAHGLDHHHFEGQGVGDGEVGMDGWGLRIGLFWSYSGMEMLGWMDGDDWVILVICWDGMGVEMLCLGYWEWDVVDED